MSCLDGDNAAADDDDEEDDDDDLLALPGGLPEALVVPGPLDPPSSLTWIGVEDPREGSDGEGSVLIAAFAPLAEDEEENVEGLGSVIDQPYTTIHAKNKR